MIESKPSEVTQDLADAKSFIEVQLPVAKLSAESYKERKAGSGQTLTVLGKWWGRKPLILVRATILGLLLPATDNPAKDREIFLKLMTMDDNGLQRRRSKNISAHDLPHLLTQIPEGKLYLDPTSDTPKLKSGLNRDERSHIQELVYRNLPYTEKLNYADRPEQISGPSEEDWIEINNYLRTNANNLSDLVGELGVRRFGHRPKVGDSFCGGGSIPFEAARIGCESYGSDLNPVAGVMSWAALNLLSGEVLARQIQEAQQTVFQSVDDEIKQWGIEHNEDNWRADTYLYCTEVVDPESGWLVPVVPSWIIASRNNVIGKLIADDNLQRYIVSVVEHSSESEFNSARSGTIKNSALVSPSGFQATPIELIRRNIRMWENLDVTPRKGDVLGERLYCIRWIETYFDNRGREQTKKHYRTPTESDLRREEKVLDLLRQRFQQWQSKGYIPSRLIEPGDETTRLQREKGWTHWHHLFTPRQLLWHGLLIEKSDELFGHDKRLLAALLLTAGSLANFDSKLCIWDSSPSKSGGNGAFVQTFSNQALNTLYNYGSRAGISLQDTWDRPFGYVAEKLNGSIKLEDARHIEDVQDIWITDPPYADAVNYHELSEFYLSWYEGILTRLFPDWYTDSKRSLAVKGDGGDFRKSMVDCYKRLAEKMPNNGLQVVMFTHQDAGVWADLAMILWAAGLRVTAAWTIATETDSMLKDGNYVQGTVLLVLRKRTATDSLFKHQLVPYIEFEVRRQLDEMTALEDASDPNFTDSDYQLAAYAAALRILTAQPIDDIDPEKELLRVRSRGEENPLKGLIEQAVRIAADHQVPKGFDKDTWKRLTPLERFYLKGLELEAHGERRSGAYQELARGFGVANYDDLFAESKANHVRLMTPTEMSRKYMQGSGFAETLLRQVLFAVYAAGREDNPRAGLDYLKSELADTYWSQRERIMHLLGYLAAQRHNGKMLEWKKDGDSADLLLGLISNDYA